MSHDEKTELKFKPIGSSPKGVGGWLALFIIGQLFLRPLLTWVEMSNPKSITPSQIADRFPTTATLLTIEKIIIIHLILFGIAVAFSLWKVRTPFSVKLAKIYLISNPIVLVLDALLYKLSDLPPNIQDTVMQHGFLNAGKAALWCIVWFLYFTNSERVHATYYNEEDVTSLGLP
jgi:hypothetical protein